MHEKSLRNLETFFIRVYYLDKLMNIPNFPFYSIAVYIFDNDNEKLRVWENNPTIAGVQCFFPGTPVDEYYMTIYMSSLNFSVESFKVQIMQLIEIRSFNDLECVLKLLPY